MCGNLIGQKITTVFLENEIKNYFFDLKKENQKRIVKHVELEHKVPPRERVELKKIDDKDKEKENDENSDIEEFKSFKEKPTFTHYANAGIYLMKRHVVSGVPKNQLFNATDLMEQLIREGKKVVAYPLVGYWLDIGKHEDYQKAQLDINTIKF